MPFYSVNKAAKKKDEKGNERVERQGQTYQLSLPLSGLLGLIDSIT